MQELRCKGLMLKNRLALLAERYDPETQLYPLLGDELRRGLQYGTVVSGGWYPIAWLRELHQAAHEVSGRGNELAWELGNTGARRNFRSVHRAFMTVMSPGGVLKRAPRVFGAYFDGGRYEVREMTTQSAIIEISGCHGFDEATWHAIAGTAHAILEMCRAREPRASVDFEADRASGVLDVRWQ